MADQIEPLTARSGAIAGVAAGGLAVDGSQRFGPLPSPLSYGTNVNGAAGNLLISTSFGTGVFNVTGMNGGTNFPAGCKVVVGVANGGGTGGVPSNLKFGTVNLTRCDNEA